MDQALTDPSQMRATERSMIAAGGPVAQPFFWRGDPSGRWTWCCRQWTVYTGLSGAAEAIRIVAFGLNSVGAQPGNFSPEALRPEIDAVDARVMQALVP